MRFGIVASAGSFLGFPLQYFASRIGINVKLARDSFCVELAYASYLLSSPNDFDYGLKHRRFH